MHPDTVLFSLLCALVGGLVPAIAWFRAQKRIRHLEMTLLAQSTDADQYEELRSLLVNLMTQTEQLADAQAQLSRRIGERPDSLPPGRADATRPITPH